MPNQNILGSIAVGKKLCAGNQNVSKQQLVNACRDEAVSIARQLRRDFGFINGLHVKTCLPHVLKGRVRPYTIVVSVVGTDNFEAFCVNEQALRKVYCHSRALEMTRVPEEFKHLLREQHRQAA